MKKVPLRHLADVNPPTPAFDRLAGSEQVTFMPLEAVWGDHRVDVSRTAVKSDVANGYVRFQAGDVLCPKVTPTFQAGRSALIAEMPCPAGASTTEVHVIRAKQGKADARFLRYLLLTSRFLTEGVSRFQGVAGLQRVPADFLASFPVADLPLDEQRRIADFLDDQVGRISALQAHRLRRVLALEEWFDRAVLDAMSGQSVDRVDMGQRVEGMPLIPTIWPVLTVASQFQVQLGKMLNEERTVGDHLQPYLRNTNVQWDSIDVDDLKVMDFPPAERSRYRVEVGDLLICEGGQPGRSAVWDGRIGEIYYQKALHRARSRGRSRARWLMYQLRAAARLGVFDAAGGTTIGHLTGEQLTALKLPFPETYVQDRILDEVDQAGQFVHQIKVALEEAQTLLEERRSALITAAVGGEIGVATASSRALLSVAP